MAERSIRLALSGFPFGGSCPILSRPRFASTVLRTGVCGTVLAVRQGQVGPNEPYGYYSVPGLSQECSAA